LHTHFTWCFLMTLLSWVLYVLYRPSVSIVEWFQVLWIYSCFIPYLKDFVLVYKFSMELVCILHFGRVFKYAKLIFKLIFENPYQCRRAVGWTIMSCMLLIENPFIHVHEREVTWVIYLILIIFSIGITIDIFMIVYSFLVFYICMLHISKGINFY